MNNNIHAPHTAGAFVVKEIPIIDESATIADVRQLLERKADSFATIQYVYVVSPTNLLRGVLSVKAVFQHHGDIPVTKIMTKEPVTARLHTEQERVARLALEHGIKAIPILNKEHKFVGVVPSDTILHILEAEHEEDILHGIGVHGKSTVGARFREMTATAQFKRRLPWLILGLVGGLGAAVIVRFFQNSLEVEIVLASFIPLVVYIADAVGSQTQTIFIRTLITSPTLKLRSYIWRETRVSFGLAIALSIIIAVVAYFWHQTPTIGIVLFFSIFSSILVSSAVALFLPWFFQKIHFDPAVASGPFATVIRDITNLVIYFSIAQIVISIMVG